MKELVLSEWQPGLQVVSLIELVRRINKNGLLSAKRDVEKFLDGETLVLSCHEEEEESLVCELKSLGVVVKNQQ